MLKANVRGSIVEYIPGEGLTTEDDDLYWDFIKTRWTEIISARGDGMANDETVRDFFEWCLHLDPDFTIVTDDEDIRLEYRIVTEGDVLID